MNLDTRRINKKVFKSFKMPKMKQKEVAALFFQNLNFPCHTKGTYF